MGAPGASGARPTSYWRPRFAFKVRRIIGRAKSDVRGFMLNATHYDWTRDNVRPPPGTRYGNLKRYYSRRALRIP